MTATTTPARAGTGIKVGAFVVTAALALVVGAVVFVILIVTLNGYTGSETNPILIGFLVTGVASAVGGGLLAALGCGVLRRAMPGWLAFAVAVVMAMVAVAVILGVAIAALIAVFPASYPSA